MVLITPVIFEFLFVVLVGGGMNAEGTVRIRFGVVVLAELVFPKDLGLFCDVFARTGVESNPMKEASTTPSL